MILATNNENKLRELREILGNNKIKSLKEANINVDVEETGKTFYENALIKARAIYKLVHEPVIADDSGLIFNELKDFFEIFSTKS